MDLSKTLLLGFIAGVTIVIGLPIGRLRSPRPNAAADAERDRGRRAALPGLGRAVRRLGADRHLAGRPAHGHAAGSVRSFGYGVAVRRRPRGRPARTGRLRPATCSVASRRPDAAAPVRCRSSERPGGDPRRRVLEHRAADRAADRRRDRPAQLRRGPRDRAVRREQRDRARHRAGHRLRAAQRHRGIRHRRAAGRRHRRGRCGASPVAGASSPAWR